MNKYNNYNLDQLIGLVRNGRMDVVHRAAAEIERRIQSEQWVIVDGGECIQKTSATSDQNPQPVTVEWIESSRCDWARLASRRKAEIESLESQIYILEKLLNERNRVIDAIPECPVHGPQCIPHALEWLSI